MARIFLLAIFLCAHLMLSTARPAGEDGEWIDDVSNNPEVMGLNTEGRQSSDDGQDVQAPVFQSMQTDKGDGEWVDDVTGNLVVMGEDPSSKGLIEGNERAKRGLEKRLRKMMKKDKRDVDSLDTDTVIIERERRSERKKLRKALKKALKF